ncbi:MAG TPA: Holliday junction branch migration protein RuvA [Deltaproteobacteria bacterium]|nr:Holliday junction branch migration protein RuvA [Deltaproteobacteria bacterium]
MPSQHCWKYCTNRKEGIRLQVVIAFIEGKLRYKSPEYIIVDVGGVGYQLYISLNTFYELPEQGDITSLNVYTHVREDSLDLFGFFSMEEKKIFLKLVAINGIGPRLALNILSGITPGELEEAVFRGNVKRLQRVPGVGKKIAERMILELKDKLATGKKEKADPRMPVIPESTGMESDAVAALLSLGYKPAEADKAVALAISELGEKVDLTLETLLKTALKFLAK